MASTLDPVTGLPMVGVGDVVSQIPLGVQVVPWDDTKAVDRPQGGPAYPNDIINTFAWVTGENVSQPGTVHAGTMTNDRRLRVDTGASAGGISPQAPLIQKFANTVTSGGGGNTFAAAFSLPSCVITGWQVAFIFSDGAPADLNNVSPLLVWMEDGSTFLDIYLLCAFPQFWSGTAWGAIAINQVVEPAVPMDLRPNAAKGGGTFDVHTNGLPADGSLAFVLTYYR